MKKIIFILSLFIGIATASQAQNLTISKSVEFKTPEVFEPTDATFKIIGVSDSTVTMFFSLVEKHPLYNGQTERTGNVTVPRPMIDALQLKYDGTVGDTTAMNNLLGVFNLKVRHDVAVNFQSAGLLYFSGTVNLGTHNAETLPMWLRKTYARLGGPNFIPAY
jgi:hypothetical protein